MNHIAEIPMSDSKPALLAAASAVDAIPPAWPLDATVAVNPFLGHVGDDLSQASQRLNRVAGVSATMPLSWYAEKIKAGDIRDSHIEQALKRIAEVPSEVSVADIKQYANQAEEPIQPLQTVADLAGAFSGIDWAGVIDDRFGGWAAGYFDAGQALWAAPKGRDAYTAWCSVAIHDLTPEIYGLDNFASFVASLPQKPEHALTYCTEQLGLSDGDLHDYFHRLLTTLGGWAQASRYLGWQAELAGRSDTTARDFLVIRLVWDVALLNVYRQEIEAAWQTAKQEFSNPNGVPVNHKIQAVLQTAFEISIQEQLSKLISSEPSSPGAGRPKLQAAFCIDVRSEVFRRALESVDPSIETLGFAGFFGISADHTAFASDVHEARCPVLLTPTATTTCGAHAEGFLEEELVSRYTARAKRAWGRFKLAAVSSFAFVEAMGPVYAAKLVKDSVDASRGTSHAGPKPRFDPALPIDDKVAMAGTILGAMSLTENFAPIVMLAGHGANVVNNPHASALHCGACGGYAGDVNARLLAELLNDKDVRAGLKGKGIEIPDDTIFVGALHDTTTDQVTLFDQDFDQPSRHASLDELKSWLNEAGRKARAERTGRLPGASSESHVIERSRDWSQVRPEWGLAGCKAFIAAPRHRTQGKTLNGEAFLHSYNWQQDEGFSVLELILTAPVVVASWISLQYYGSTVAPEVFGGGNKVLHNVTGGMGVVEGNGGLLKAGLPWQSVHDGERYIHDPVRLSVFIEAPRDAVIAILEKHEGVKTLFDQGWLNLFILDDEGAVKWRYTRNLAWEEAE